MSYPLDVEAQNAALDALLSRDVSGIPTVWELAIYNGDPRFDGVELDAAGGYERVLVNADLADWPAAVDGIARTWTGGPCAPVPARGAVDAYVNAAHFDTFSTTIPFYNPNGS